MNGFLAGQPVIAGSGLAGLIVALRLSPRPVVLLSAAALSTETSSGWAQGGIAAAVGADDAAELHIADTLAAGAGLCDAGAVRRIIEAGPRAIAALSDYGATFDRAPGGALSLGLEAAHSRRRIVHASGDGTGGEIVRALVAAVRATPSITVLEGASLARVLVSDGAVRGVAFRMRGDRSGRLRRLRTSQLVIATGGAGGLFLDTTNPLGSTGAGLAIAARAGAALADIEFIQFHPTALAVSPSGQARGAAPMPLISEAVRGEGATLIDETGERFMDNELAPRDVVSRAVWRHLEAGHSAFLDARAVLGARFEARFPAIAASCRARGIDPARMPIPIRPAAHYHMGGIAVDADGRSTVPGLWACGEAACTGPARRQPPGQQLPAGGRGLRRAGRRQHRRDIGSCRCGVAAGSGHDRDATLARHGSPDRLPRSRRAARRARPATRGHQPVGPGRAFGRGPAGFDDRARRAGAGGKPRRPLPRRLSANRGARRAHPVARARGARRRPRAAGGAPRVMTPLADVMLEPLVRAALLEDLGRAGDITTEAMVPAALETRVVLSARDAGVVAGLDLARLAFRLIEPRLAFAVLLPDASPVAPGDVIASIDGPARGILTAERVALNYLCHLSGIASATNRLVQAVRHTKARICCTRKTTPGLRAVQKYAVRAGGGSNHRFGLDDAVLIKDNHIAMVGGVMPAIRRAREAVGHLVKIEVEIDTLAQLEQALTVGADAFLLDNMTPSTLREAVAMIGGRATTEASGRITPETAVAIAEAGVDLISAGWLTHSVSVLDIGLDAVPA